MLTDEEIKKIVEHYQMPFTECWSEAFKDYATKYAETRHVHSPLTRACTIRDHCIDHVQRKFANDESVNCDKKTNGLFVVFIDGSPLGIAGSVAARLKKLDEKLLASNIPTKQSVAFDEQRPVFATAHQLDLFGFPLTSVKVEPAHINIGYLPDNFWMSFEGVYATLPNGKRSIKWFVNLSDAAQILAAPIIEMKIEPKPSPQIRKRVRVKRAVNEQSPEIGV